MKYILLLLTFNSYANYIGQSLVGVDLTGKPIFTSMASCKSHYKETCQKLPSGYDYETHVLVDEYIPDTDKPVYSKNEVETCQATQDNPETPDFDETMSQEDDCKDKELNKVCSDDTESVVRVAENTEVYCSKFLRYETKLSGNKTIVKDMVKHQAKMTAMQLKQAEETAIAQAMQAIEFGKRVIAMVSARNAQKNLTTQQVVEINQRFADIKGLLETGAIETARDMIMQVQTDATVVTEADKNYLIEKLNEYLNAQ